MFIVWESKKVFFSRKLFGLLSWSEFPELHQPNNIFVLKSFSSLNFLLEFSGLLQPNDIFVLKLFSQGKKIKRKLATIDDLRKVRTKVNVYCPFCTYYLKDLDHVVMHCKCIICCIMKLLSRIFIQVNIGVLILIPQKQNVISNWKPPLGL